MGSSPTIVRAHGPAAIEADLVARLTAERDRVRADPTLLASPLVIVTASDALRVHVAGLAARAVGALAGVRIATLSRIAQETLARAGAPVARGADAAEIVIARAARAAFAHVDPRFGAAAAASITDLLDAGLTDESGSAVLEALDDTSDRLPLGGSARATAEAVVRAALAARARIDELELARPADVLARAAEALRRADRGAGCRALWIHGFTDATGVQADLLEALAAAVPTTLYYDDAAMSPRYGAALRARFGLSDAPPRASPRAPTASFRARGAEAEVREVLRRVRRDLDAGAAPECIAIVARHLGPYQAALRTHSSRLAVPISGEGGRGPVTAAGRRIRARLELLVDARAATLERWLSAHETRASDELALLVGLRALGLGRVGALAELDVAGALGDRTTLRLPLLVARYGELEDDDEADDAETDDADASEDAEADVRRPEDARTLPRAAVEGAAARARELAVRAVDPESEARPVEHSARVGATLALLGARPDDPLVRAAHELADDLGRDFQTTWREFLDALAGRLESAIEDPIGGAGGGVLVADAASARRRAYQHVYVLGLNAGAFPPVAREDALLSDDARGRIAAVLPDLALKRARSEEERAIFAQLLASAADVTVSWLVVDSDDEPLAPSPLLETAGIAHPEKVAIARGAIEPDEGVPQPLLEHAQIAARDGSRAEAAAVLELAIAEARAAHALDAGVAPRIAAARAAVLAELSRPPGRPEPLGPYFGGVGPARLEARTKREIAVTTLENVARCPWQAFLQRVLVIRPPLDPLLSAPRLDARATGSVAHALLADTAPKREVALEDVEESVGAAPTWPRSESMFPRALAHAARILREEGRYVPGLDALVAARALELVEAARRLDASEPGLLVLGAEVRALVQLPGERFVAFRADRVERAVGRLRLTDWKSGKVFGDAVQTATRARRHRAAIRTGAQIQAFVYALAGGEGRYVALHPKFAADERRIFSVRPDDEGCGDAYERATGALLSAWDAGAFFPRLVEHDVHVENTACAQCELAAACVRGDSGQRLRFAQLAQRTEEPPAGSHEAHVRRVLALRAPEPEVEGPSGSDTAPKPARKKKSKAAEDAP